MARHGLSIRQLAPIWRSPQSPSGLVLVLRLYCDASGTKGQISQVVGGFLASEAQWKSFEHEWQCALDAAKVIAYHATEFFSFQGEFAGWDKPDLKKHIRFAKRFASIAGRHRTAFVSRGVDLAGYEKAAPVIAQSFPGAPHERFTPLMFCHLIVMNELNNPQVGVPLGEKVAVILEDEKGAGEVVDYVNARKRGGAEWAQIVSSITTLGKEYLPLQGADLLAHESWRLCNEIIAPTGRELRRSFKKLVQGSKPVDIAVARAEDQERMMVRLGVLNELEARQLAEAYERMKQDGRIYGGWQEPKP